MSAPPAVSLPIAILTLALLVAVVLVISAPLRAGRRREEAPPSERSELEAARETKYREIRDAELDYRTGKLSREDHELVSGTLRAEALEILDRLTALDGDRGTAEQASSGEDPQADR